MPLSARCLPGAALILAATLALTSTPACQRPAPPAPPRSGVPPAPPGPAPGAGTVTAEGGTVDRLWFAVTGDTRPPDCDATDQYPRAAIQQIAKAMKDLRVQFAVDMGDHMFVCNQSRAEADQQMGYFMEAVRQGPSPWFMALGNHECGTAHLGSTCRVGVPDANFDSYMAALGRPKPWYAFDVRTQHGVARFVVVADDAWSDEQARWLEDTLADADAHAWATFAFRHHPLEGARSGDARIIALLDRHRATLVFNAHDHVYERNPANRHGRSVGIGLGGAPSPSPPGFGTVVENLDGTFTFVLRDLSGNPVGAPWSVSARD